MKQPEDSAHKSELMVAGQNMPPDSYDQRQQRNEVMRGMIDDRRDSRGAPAGAEYHRVGNTRSPELPQQSYRGDRPLPREIDIDEFDGRSEAARSMAAHPLFRGLLQELPPRSAPPSKEWLDRWSSTSRSILELLYSRDPVQ